MVIVESDPRHLRALFDPVIKRTKTVVVQAFKALSQRFLRKRHAYRALFLMDEAQSTLNPIAEIVMGDLARFCRASSSTACYTREGALDRDAMLIAEGRREVWLHIQKHLNLSDAAIYHLQAKERSYDD